jgi:hypothetical protein
MKTFIPVCDDDLFDRKPSGRVVLVPYHQDYICIHRLRNDQVIYQYPSNRKPGRNS